VTLGSRALPDLALYVISLLFGGLWRILTIQSPNSVLMSTATRGRQPTSNSRGSGSLCSRRVEDVIMVLGNIYVLLVILFSLRKIFSEVVCASERSVDIPLVLFGRNPLKVTLAFQAL
jgi:hypothetical protein